MKLYYSPGACSLATRISLHEAGLAAEFERVDLRSKITEHGFDYTALNPKGTVPMLVLDDDQAVTENVAILSLIAEREPKLAPGGPHGHTLLIEYLSYLSSELHVAFRPLWGAPSEIDRAKAHEAISRHLSLIEDCMRELYLFGPRFTVADAYLFAMLRWVQELNLPVPTELFGYFERVLERPNVSKSLVEEGLPIALRASSAMPAVSMAAT